MKNKTVKQNNTNKFYLIVEDFVRVAVGPFPTRYAAKAHFDWCKNVRGDGADLIGIVNQPGGIWGLDVIDPVEDKAFNPDDVLGNSRK